MAIKYLIGLVVFFFFPLPANTSVSSMEEETSKEYSRFLRSPTYKSKEEICSSVQFAEHLTTQMRDVFRLGEQKKADHYRQMIQALLVLGEGVGGLSKRQATPKEEEIMIQSLMATGLYKQSNDEDLIVGMARRNKSYNLPINTSLQSNHITIALEIINMSANVNPFHLSFHPHMGQDWIKSGQSSKEETYQIPTHWITLLRIFMMNNLDQKYKHHPLYDTLQTAIRIMCDHASTRVPPKKQPVSIGKQREANILRIKSPSVPLLLPWVPGSTPNLPSPLLAHESVTIKALKSLSAFIQKIKINDKIVQIVNVNIDDPKSNESSPNKNGESLSSLLGKILESILNHISHTVNVETVITIQKPELSNVTTQSFENIIPSQNSWNAYGSVKDSNFHLLTFYQSHRYSIKLLDQKKEGHFLALGFYLPKKDLITMESQPTFVVKNVSNYDILLSRKHFTSTCNQLRTVPKIIVGDFNTGSSPLDFPATVHYKSIKKKLPNVTTGIIFQPGLTKPL